MYAIAKQLSLKLIFFEDLKQTRQTESFQAIVRFHGAVNTNKGVGAVFELVRDPINGRPAPTLFHEMKRTHTNEEKEELAKAFYSFRLKLLSDGVICRDLTPWNVCVINHKNGMKELKLIDGIGHPNYKRYGRLSVLVKMIFTFWKREFISLRRLGLFCDRYGSRTSLWKAGPQY